MKKRIFPIILFISAFAFVLSLPAATAAAGKGKAEQKQQEHYVTKTYQLKHISPREVSGLKAYYVKSSYSHTGGMITIVIRKELIPRFEALLKKLDQPRRTVQLKIFTFLASTERGKTPEVHGDLQEVLKELSKVLAFKSFQLDGRSSMMVQEGQRSGRLLLSSNYELDFKLRDLTISNENKGSRKVRFNFILEGPYVTADPKDARKKERKISTLVASNASLEENGYLVAGVSKLGDNGHSLVLILHCTIQ